VLKALDIAPHGEIVTGIFHDVPKEHWVNPLISEAVKRKIVSTEREVFEPNRAVAPIVIVPLFPVVFSVRLGELSYAVVPWHSSNWYHATGPPLL
jgi:hypothetical protein